MSRDKLRTIVALLQAETRSPSSRSTEALTKLNELAVIYQRDCMHSVTTDQGLLRAREQMHARPANPWTVESLARVAGMSRAVFARKFTAAFSDPPLQHLHALRMERAASLLSDPESSLAAVGIQVGYQSEWAFSRAFKRHHGVAPGTFRRQSLNGFARTATLARAA